MKRTLSELTKKDLYNYLKQMEYLLDKNNRDCGFALQDKYTKDAKIITLWADNENAWFTYEDKLWGRQWYWNGENGQYNITKEEITEKLWKVILEDYKKDDEEEDPLTEKYTEREKFIMSELGKGKRQSEIAKELGISRQRVSIIVKQLREGKEEKKENEI